MLLICLLNPSSFIRHWGSKLIIYGCYGKLEGHGLRLLIDYKEGVLFYINVQYSILLVHVVQITKKKIQWFKIDYGSDLPLL
jgi:hypothetical protein